MQVSRVSRFSQVLQCSHVFPCICDQFKLAQKGVRSFLVLPHGPMYRVSHSMVHVNAWRRAEFRSGKMVALTDDWNFESSQNPTRFTSRNYCAKATECYIRDKVTTTKLASEVSQTLNLQNLSGFQAALVFHECAATAEHTCELRSLYGQLKFNKHSSQRIL
jgi:hypothetical protein